MTPDDPCMTPEWPLCLSPHQLIFSEVDIHKADALSALFNSRYMQRKPQAHTHTQKHTHALCLSSLIFSVSLSGCKWFQFKKWAKTTECKHAQTDTPRRGCFSAAVINLIWAGFINLPLDAMSSGMVLIFNPMKTNSRGPSQSSGCLSCLCVFVRLEERGIA